ncbi:acyltransferase [Sulfuricurvum sp.]|uniref:acyltransferase n=1 Tax=Sulfuricurvum sp. TaxID=2025608 RepID=UPI00261EC9C7|nr:acyltransferase [Sulfuricurvum sp.]MDD2266018.1 acyltransferase [Sulfuricurvum sp.]MDD2783030.1 acyltransferase [Sulfuricurvum sp.]
MILKTGKIVNLIRYGAGIPKSIYFNFRVLPFLQAIRLPIIVSRKTKLQSLSGKVKISTPKTGMIRIGFGNIEMIDYRYQRTVVFLEGTLTFKGKCKIGLGSKLIVTGELELGENFLISGDGTIICNKKITIGDHSQMAWESIIMDTDHHQIYDENNRCINEDKEVSIGNNVWIGARSFILKGSSVKDGCIIGANTTVTKPSDALNAIIAGNPARVVKENITWK